MFLIMLNKEQYLIMNMVYIMLPSVTFKNIFGERQQVAKKKKKSDFCEGSMSLNINLMIKKYNLSLLTSSSDVIHLEKQLYLIYQPGIDI